MKKINSKKVILIFSILLNISLIFSIGFVANHYKENIYQKIIDKKHKADIVMFGDSHTAGGKWNSLITDYSVKRLGWGGFTSDWLRGLINKAIEYKPEYVFILCGGNDVGQRCFKIDNVITNYKIMADTLRKHNIKPVFQKLFYQVKNQKYNNIVDTINIKLENYCKQENIEFLDITKGLNEGHHLNIDVCRDGNVHLNERGYIIWAKHLNEFLKRHN